MNFGFDIKEPSTLRGIVRILTAGIGAGMIYTGHGTSENISQLLLLSAALSGSMGIGFKDK
jgi:hypothetical protein